MIVVLLSQQAEASLTNPQVPAFRGGPCSRYAAWESFTSPHLGTNLPDDPLSTATNASLVQTVPGAIITGAGNIYHPTATPSFVLSDAAAMDLQELVLQVSTLGNVRDSASFFLQYQDSQGQPQAIAPTSVQLLAQSGQQTEHLYAWELSAVADTILAYEIHWDATAEHSSCDALILDTREDCDATVQFCFGDGTQATPCPCANNGQPGRGCDNSAATGGALLTGKGTLTPDTFVLTSTGEIGSTTSIFLQGDVSIVPGILFGDGVRCAGGNLKRLYVKFASLGTATAPNFAAGDLSITAQSAALGDPIAPGTARYYQTYYRDANLAFCPTPPGNSWNVTNGMIVNW